MRACVWAAQRGGTKYRIWGKKMQNDEDITELMAVKYPVANEITLRENFISLDVSPFYQIRVDDLTWDSVLPLVVRSGSKEVWIRCTIEQLLTLRDRINQLLQGP